jgi:hypothetical protein
MTRRLPPGLGNVTSAPKVPEGARVPCVTCGAVRSEREQWTFTGREQHWGYTYLVWTRDDGKRWPVVLL